MNPKSPQTEKDPGKQLKKFDQLPAKNKDLEVMKDQAEKSSGPERVDINRKIRAKSDQPENPGEKSP